LEEQLFEDEWLPKDSQARYGDDLDLVFPQSQNLFVEMAASDKFGYTWSELAGAPWEDITGQGALEFNDRDDGFAGPVAIGFSFPFYEKAYTQLYVSTDGLVTFENGVIDTSNQLLPHDIKPNNLIAPLWMDLNTCHVRPCTNKVFTKLLSSPDRFVIQWTEVVPAMVRRISRLSRSCCTKPEISSSAIKPSPATWENIRSGSKTATARMG
jgi:hypothetical protein